MSLSHQFLLRSNGWGQQLPRLGFQVASLGNIVMYLDACNSYLQAFAGLNDGANHGSTYCIEQLPSADSLDVALGLYFSAMYTSRTPPQPAASWNIRTTRLADDWESHLTEVAIHWFFRQEFSPRIEDYNDYKVQGAAKRFLERLTAIVGASRAFQVETTPPMWYECVWADYAFERGNSRWLLHFGFSD